VSKLRADINEDAWEEEILARIRTVEDGTAVGVRFEVMAFAQDVPGQITSPEIPPDDVN